MNKLTKEEKEEIKILIYRLYDSDYEQVGKEDVREVESDFRKWIEQKKKQWQEQAVNEYIEWYRKELAMDWKLKIGDDRS